MNQVMMPIPVRHEVKCIVQDGKNYCEEQYMGKKDIGIFAFSAVGLFIWFSIWFWIGIKIEEEYEIFSLFIILPGSIFLPLLIIGIVSLF